MLFNRTYKFGDKSLQRLFGASAPTDFNVNGFRAGETVIVTIDSKDYIGIYGGAVRLTNGVNTCPDGLQHRVIIDQKANKYPVNQVHVPSSRLNKTMTCGIGVKRGVRYIIA